MTRSLEACGLHQVKTIDKIPRWARGHFLERSQSKNIFFSHWGEMKRLWKRAHGPSISHPFTRARDRKLIIFCTGLAKRVKFLKYFLKITFIFVVGGEDDRGRHRTLLTRFRPRQRWRHRSKTSPSDVLVTIFTYVRKDFLTSRHESAFKNGLVTNAIFKSIDAQDAVKTGQH